jgi:hypothetical protein
MEKGESAQKRADLSAISVDMLPPGRYQSMAVSLITRLPKRVYTSTVPLRPKWKFLAVT